MQKEEEKEGKEEEGKKGKEEKAKKGKEEKVKKGKEEELQEEKEGVALGQLTYPPKEEVLDVFNLKTNL